MVSVPNGRGVGVVGRGCAVAVQKAASEPHVRAATTPPTHDREVNSVAARSGWRGPILRRSGGPESRSTSLMTESRLLEREEVVGRALGANHEQWFGFEPRDATTRGRYRPLHAPTEQRPVGFGEAQVGCPGDGVPADEVRKAAAAAVSWLWCRRRRRDHANRGEPARSSSSCGRVRRSRPATSRGSNPPRR